MLDTLTILAPGLLGGSVARAARARKVARRIVIWARKRETRRSLAGQPWCDRVADTPGDAVEGADLVVIAAPVDRIVPLVRRIAPRLSPGTVVTDVGSVKGTIVREAHAALRSRAHFVGSHPMAGSEKAGWRHGTADLFDLRTCFVTPLSGTNRRAAALVEGFWRDLGARVATVDPRRHDEIVAHISHLPQILASSLCSFLAGKDPAWLAYAGGGLRDTTRIAGGEPGLWRAILEQNRGEVLRALKKFEAELGRFRAAIGRDDWTGLTRRLARAKACRDRLPAHLVP